MWALLFLLLPFAALTGWWIGKRNNQPKMIAHGQVNEYSAGLNYLFNEQTERAVDFFIKMLESSPDSVEITLALGNFFRKRGEVSRAIYIHSRLMDTPQLSDEVRNQSLLALARDYIQAGMFDRAENILITLTSKPNEQLESGLKDLIHIYEREKEWHKAINCAKRFNSFVANAMDKSIAHYYCELSEEAFDQGRTKQAFGFLKKGLTFDNRCARINMAFGVFEQKLGKTREALLRFQAVHQQDPEFLPEVLPMIIECYEQLSLPDELKCYLDRLGSYVGGVVNNQPTYRCKQCGFSSRLLNWQCPSCFRWAALKPIQAIEGK